MWICDKLHDQWRFHQNEIFSAFLALSEGNSPITGEFPSQRPVMRSLDVFFDLNLNKRSGKPSRRWWFEKPLRSLWRHCKVWNSKFVNTRKTEFLTPWIIFMNVTLIQMIVTMWWTRGLHGRFHIAQYQNSAIMLIYYAMLCDTSEKKRFTFSLPFRLDISSRVLKLNHSLHCNGNDRIVTVSLKSSDAYMRR